MASFKIGLFLLLSVFSFHLFSTPVLCGVEEENLLEDINSYRQNLDLPVLEEYNQAACLAQKIADKLGDEPCEKATDYGAGGSSNIPNFEKFLRKCGININTTKDGVIMPVCLPDLPRNAVLSNYTKSKNYGKYVNDSKFTGAGIGSEDDWMVLILSTDTYTGSFSSATSLLANACKGLYLGLPFFLGALIVLIY